MRFALLSTALIFLVIENTQSQNLWHTDLFNESKTLYEVETNFENYWSNKEVKKGKGWKPFKRRQSFMAPRVYPTGIFPFEKLYQEWEALKYTPKNSSQTVLQADWQAYGPSYSSFQGGVGRINVVTFDPYNSDIIWVGAQRWALEIQRRWIKLE